MHAQLIRNPFVEHAIHGMSPRVLSMAGDAMKQLRSRHENNAPEVIRLSYRNQPLQPREVVADVRGDIISEGWRPALGVLLLFDPWPYSNWGHECWVAGLDAARYPGPNDWLVEREFPPEQDDASHLVPCANYHANGELAWYYPQEASSE